MDFYFFVAIFFGLGCTKEKIVEEMLPPETQVGANTFGCKVNGNIWVAKNANCSYLCNSPITVDYQSNEGGYVSVVADLLDVETGRDEFIALGTDSTDYKQTHTFPGTSKMRFTFYNARNVGDCRSIRSEDSSASYSGQIIFTRYDLNAGIISGRFNFNLTKPGCEPISVTEGRFDKKLY